MQHNMYIYILSAFAVTYAIRVLPLTLIRKPIKNRFIRSFLFYVPYVTLSVMTFPAIIYVSGSIWPGIAALTIGIITAWYKGNLFTVALSACVAVLVTEAIMLL